MDFLTKFLGLLAGLTLSRRFRWYAGTLVLFMIVGVGCLVYSTGGIKFAYSHTMYLPVLLGAMIFGGTGGLFFGLLGGLVLGPWMPVDITTGETQLALNWLFRAGIFILTGALFGATMTYLRRQFERLRWSASHDAVTGMPNNIYLQQELAMEESEGSSPFVAVAHLNIKNFFEITNTLGTDAGVALAEQIYSRIKDALPENGCVARTDSERFSILLPAENKSLASSAMERIFQITKTSFMVEGIPVYADVCAGVAGQTRDGSGFATLVRKANIALRSAQTSGQELVWHTPAFNNLRRDRIALIGEIPEAIQKDQFNLHFQPKINLARNEIIGVEALLRWDHPERGPVPPGEFIFQIENTGLIHLITRWVAVRALEQLRYWRNEGLIIAMAFNISTRNFLEADLLPFLRAQIERFDIPPDKVELEITESAVMADIERATSLLGELKRLGVSISVDDFGTGHSSLAYLKQLPVDTIKIDQKFIRALASDQADMKIVNAMIAMGKGLGLKTVAEGVEDEATADILRKLGCDTAQGFYFCRPEPAEVITSLLKAGSQLGREPRL